MCLNENQMVTYILANCRANQQEECKTIMWFRCCISARFILHCWRAVLWVTEEYRKNGRILHQGRFYLRYLQKTNGKTCLWERMIYRNIQGLTLGYTVCKINLWEKMRIVRNAIQYLWEWRNCLFLFFLSGKSETTKLIQHVQGVRCS